MYAITGASGNIGREITLSLLSSGQEVRIISRNAEEVKYLTEKGAKLFRGDAGDGDILKGAFNGVKAVFAMIPIYRQAENHPLQRTKHAKAIATAIKDTNVKNVVALSSLGAHLNQCTGIIIGLHNMENFFNSIPELNTLHLRPGFFMENTLGMINSIKHAGIMGTPTKSSLKFPAIATKDIAQYATRRLLNLDFEGINVQNLLGEREITYKEMAQIIGNAIGRKELKYIELPYQDFKNILITQMGCSINFALNYIEFLKALNNGFILSESIRDQESTTPTSFEEFAKTFANIYKSLNLD